MQQIRLRKSPVYFFASRLGALLLGFALAVAIAFIPTSPAIAQNPIAKPVTEPITWDDLQAQSTHLTNPYAHLSTAQTYRLSSLYQLKEWAKENQPDPDSFEVQEIKRLEQSFVDEDIDTAALLTRVGEARDYWRSHSQTTNPDLEDRAVQLSGYILPLNEDSQTRQSERVSGQVSEFLLVPYVGACIHVPPPPPNQMVYIKPAAAIKNPGMFSSVLVTGTLRASAGSYELFQVDGSRTVDVSYTMDLETIASDPNAPAPKITGTWWQTLPAKVSGVLTTSLGNLSTQTSGRTLILALLLSFSYGVLHTLGPGHGKAVIVSYFVGHDGSLQRGITMGVRIAMFHVLSAVVIAILTNTVVQQVGGSSAGSYRIVRLISYGAIALIGMWMLKRAFQKRAQLNKQPSKYPAYLDANSADTLLYPSLSQQLSASEKQPEKPEKQPALAACDCLSCDEPKGLGGWLSLAVGAVPCSGALLVLLYGLANNLLWPSIAMVVSISVGMAFTLSWIGALAILGNRFGQQLAARRQQRSSWAKRHRKARFSLVQIGQIIGASCVSLLGMGLFSLTLLAAG